MRKENLLSRAEMKKVMGGLFPVQLWFDNCILQVFSGNDYEPNDPEYMILYRMCELQAENMCAQEIALGRECWLVT